MGSGEWASSVGIRSGAGKRRRRVEVSEAKLNSQKSPERRTSNDTNISGYGFG